MRRNYRLSSLPLRTVYVALVALALLSSRPAAQTHAVHLIAAPVTKTVTLPDGRTVLAPMWGLALDANDDGVLDPGETPTVPGPRITVPPGTAALTVYLTNALGAGAEPISLVIPGQAFQATPVTNSEGRIVSMTHETSPGSTGAYTFTGLKPGTFLYQSGSHPAVQVQMGLYGAMTMDAASGEAYTGVPYQNDVLLLYSEIDLKLHEAVANGTYGHPELGGPTSTINYAPTLFLVNGESYANELSTTVNGGRAGERSLLRLLNAGLRTHVPVMDGDTLTIVAEDGNASPFPLAQASVVLAAGKTHDVTWTPSAAGVVNVYDRMLSLSAEGQGSAGMLVKLSVAESTTTPPPAPLVSAANDSYSTAEDAPLAVAAGGVLGNDTAGSQAQIVTSAHSGTVALVADGSFTYQPSANFFGVDSFTYHASIGADVSAPATVTITVTPVPDSPVAIAQDLGVDAAGVAHAELKGTDPDGDAITFYLSSLPTNGTVSIIDPNTLAEQALTAADIRAGAGTGTAIPAGVIIYKPEPGSNPSSDSFSGTDAFTFVVADAALDSTPAAVSATVHPPAFDADPTGTPLALAVVGSDGAAISNYRWTLEEDRMYFVVPGVADPATAAVSFHASYMPVVQSGTEATPPIVDPSKRYFVSVVPTANDYANSGASVAAGQTAVTVKLQKGPQPTAQFRVRVFEDNAGLNGMWDSTEPGLQGFEVTIDDAGGRYGMSGGHQGYDAFGNPIGTTYAECSTGPGTCTSYEVAHRGDGFVLTDADGYALISNLPPGKYTVKVRAPGGEAWIQTSTIEGTPGIDAWAKSNEPQFFSEFGPPGPHVFVGFVRATKGAGVLGAGSGPFSTVSGRITNMHMSRPPDPRLYSANSHTWTRPWVALNSGVAGGALLYAQPTNEDGTFSIGGVPSGSYQLVVFDSALDLIISMYTVNVSAPTVTALGDIPVFDWFAHLTGMVFEDTNENGFRDPGEPPMGDQNLNVRWRDGTVYQSTPTTPDGMGTFDEMFPFFTWLVAEVDFARFKATGVTVVVDKGGDTSIDTTWPGLIGAPNIDSRVLAPQPQSENGGLPYRTETGSPLILLEGFQAFLGQTNVMLWGKAPYAPTGSVVSDVDVAPFDDFPGPGDTDGNGNGRFDVDTYHGGITGIVHYSITRAENDPRWGTAEPWEPGIPSVRVQLWDKSRKHLLNEVVTDSWDESQPSGCQGEVFTFRGRPTDCYDGLRNFNQARPAVFDGGYYIGSLLEPFVDEYGQTLPIASRTTKKPLPAGDYVVKIIVPRGYKLVTEDDKNVDFGDQYIPAQFYLTGYPLGDEAAGDAQPKTTVDEYPLAAPFCVGALHEAGAELALFPGVPATYAGDQRPLCDAKLVSVRDGANGAANFFLFTEAPIAGHIVGFVLDDTTNEFDPNAPTFGEKYAPPFMPVSIRDWTGREVVHTYTDEYGVYNVLVPSTYTAAVPEPSGMSPSMLTACINSPTTLGPDGSTVPEPHFHKEYTHFCYTMQFMPGSTSFLDTPVLPTGAFTGNGSFPVDAELPNLTPVIASVNNPALNLGPYIVDRGVLNTAARTIVITSVGNMQVPNPAYDGAGGTQAKLVQRDYSFGPASPGGFVTLDGQRLSVTSWTNASITAVVPTGASFRTGQLVVERCLTPKIGTGASQTCNDDRASILGLTLNVATPAMHTARPPKVVNAGQKIQPVIDAAKPGDLIIVRPGTYEEALVMSKPVRLQGSGALSTVINVVSSPSENIQNWLDYVGSLLLANPSYLIANQPAMTPAPFIPGDVAAVLGGEGGGVLVLGKNQATLLGICLGSFPTPSNEAFCRHNENYGSLLPVLKPNARIDGFTIQGSSNEAGVMLNGRNRYIEISNNRIYNNVGDFAGGIRVGHPGSVAPLVDTNADNNGIAIHNNMVVQNAGLGASSGGGIVIGTGATSYSVSNNFVAGNFTAGYGAGIAHIGLSQLGVIDHNTVIFNESFSQGVTTSGGGIFVGGRAAAAGALTPGSGNVQITNNLVQGNQAAGGDGGGIALGRVNGTDILQFRGILSFLRYRVNLFNNMIANNEAALAGGGVALQDAAYVDMTHNTIVHNDSLATAGAAFTAGPTQSVPQPAGVVSRGHSPLLALALGSGEPAFSKPAMANSIVWQNRSFYFGQVSGGGIIVPPPPGGPTPTVQYGLIANATLPNWDLGVLGAAAGSALGPQYSVLTSTTGYAATNISTAPLFAASYYNGDRRQNYMGPEITNILAPAAFDEGGNFIRPQFGPLSLQLASGAFFGNYHVTTGVNGQALNTIYGVGIPAALRTDFDREARPTATPAHRGADQKVGASVPVSPIPR